MSWTDVSVFVLNHAKSLQFALFGLVIISLWLAELGASARPAMQKLAHTSLNAFYMLAAMPIQVMMMIVCTFAAGWTMEHHWGLVYFLPQSENPWIRLGLMVLVLDLLDYAYHRAAHKFSPLWRFHLLHHTDSAVDVSTTFREHPVETLIRTSLLALAVFFCGASLAALVIRQTLETFANTSQHTTFRLPNWLSRALGYVFITPNLHHTHHHFETPGTNCNYGDVLSIWDRLFGTYIDLPADDIVFGLDTHAGQNADGKLLRLLSVILPSRISQTLAALGRSENLNATPADSVAG